MLEDLKKRVQNNNSIFLRESEDYNQFKFNYEALKNKLEEFKKDLSLQEENTILYEKSKNCINKIILNTRNEAINFIESVVNCALFEVFNKDSLKLKLILNSEGSKASISACIEEDGEIYDIESGRGGGLRDLVSTAILLCCRALVKPKVECPLLLDESFKFLHSTKDNAYKKNAFRFLQNVASKLNTQIILITGEADKDAIEAADNVIFVSKKDGQSYLEK